MPNFVTKKQSESRPGGTQIFNPQSSILNKRRGVIMSIKKQYLKSKPVCKVTFRLPEEAAKSVRSANIVGEFNDWGIHANPMRKLKNGSFTVTIDL
jgi:1,4-alpha-glucan branching enzyme